MSGPLVCVPLGRFSQDVAAVCPGWQFSCQCGSAHGYSHRHRPVRLWLGLIWHLLSLLRLVSRGQFAAAGDEMSADCSSTLRSRRI